MRQLISAVLALLVASATSRAQSAPGTRILVSVALTSVAQVGDTFSVTHRISVLPASPEPLYSVTIEAPAVPVQVVSPGPDSFWLTSSRHGARPVAAWDVLDTSLVSAGETSPPLMFRAVGVPGIVSAYISGYYEPPELADDSLRAASDPLVVRAITLQLVGIVPVDPAAPPSSHAARIAELAAQACTLGWISNHGTCSSLEAKLSAASRSIERRQINAARNQLQAFMHELGAQRGKHVDENAYQLLHHNAVYLLGRI